METEIRALDECRFSSGMGTINASGVIKNIRGSKLSVSEIFLREAVQNSYDARLKEVGGKSKTVNFTMRAFNFTNKQFSFLQNILDKNKDPFSFYRKYLKSNLKPDMLNIEISDSNTTGLRGAIEPTDKIENQNFADFVYSTGSKPKEESSGGTFGFGKAALYAYSKARTIIVYTRISSNITVTERKYQSRFIIICNDERITDTKSDRCWWGIEKERSDKKNGTYASPVLGSDADSLANMIGMSSFEAEETGTKILVLNASPDELPEDEYGNIISVDEIIKERMPYYIVHWYWNKILCRTINFKIIYNSEEIEILNPESLYPYSEFCKAYSKYDKNKKEKKLQKTKTFSVIESKRPIATLGYCSLADTPVMRIKPRRLFSVFATDEPVIAYMRGIGHIVYYEKINLNSNHIEQTCYGIFKTDKNSAPDGEERGAIDKYFAEIENQTHDRWEHRDEQFKRNYLKTVLHDVNELVQSNCSIHLEEEKTADISIMVQRVLGAKLMPHITNIGGAKAPLPNDVMLDSKNIISKSTLTATGKTEIVIEKGVKVSLVEYKAKIKKGKKLKVNSIVPRIQTLDSSDKPIVDSSIAKFLCAEFVLRDGGLKILTKDNFEIQNTQSFYIKVSLSKDCVFDIKVDWEEKDA